MAAENPTWGAPRIHGETAQAEDRIHLGLAKDVTGLQVSVLTSDGVLGMDTFPNRVEQREDDREHGIRKL